MAQQFARPDAIMGALTINDQVIGDIGGLRYRPQTLDPEPNSWEISLGYTVRPDRWGEGIATCAVALLGG